MKEIRRKSEKIFEAGEDSWRDQIVSGFLGMDDHFVHRLFQIKECPPRLSSREFAAGEYPSQNRLSDTEFYILATYVVTSGVNPGLTISEVDSEGKVSIRRKWDQDRHDSFFLGVRDSFNDEDFLEVELQLDPAFLKVQEQL